MDKELQMSISLTKMIANCYIKTWELLKSEYDKKVLDKRNDRITYDFNDTTIYTTYYNKITNIKSSSIITFYLLCGLLDMFFYNHGIPVEIKAIHKNLMDCKYAALLDTAEKLNERLIKED